MKTVTIESPYAGDIERNLQYLKECILDCFARDEAPFASHRMYTDALDDNDPHQRQQGIIAGLTFAARCDKRVFYVDLGWSGGMKAALEWYKENGLSYEVRSIHIDNKTRQ